MHPAAVSPTSRTHLEHVEIRARKVVAEDKEATILEVRCPERHRAIPLQDCLTCAYCKGLHVDAETEHSFLVCELGEPSRAEPESFASRGSAEARDAATTSIAEIMSRQVVCVPADMDVESLTELFLERGFSGAPVIDGHGHPIGIVSKTDLLRSRHERGDSGEVERVSVARGGYRADLGPGFHVETERTTRVRDIMMPLTFALPQGESIARAAALMAFEGVHRVAVVGPDRSIVGIVSSLDVLKWLAKRAGFVVGA
jgi:CBS domain-containing protein